MPRTISAPDYVSRSASAPDFRREVAGPLAVPAVNAAAGTVLTLAAAAWRRLRPASRASQCAAQVPAAAAASLAA